MKLQQLRYVCTVARNGLNISEAASSLNTSQPGVSKQIRMLEDELKVDIFVRSGKRLVALTEPGRMIVDLAEKILHVGDNIQRVAEEFTEENAGKLTIATTHTQARYALPAVVQAFRQKYPQVTLSLRQGNPIQIAEQVANGDADIAIATEGIDQFEGLIQLPCYQWNRCIVTPPAHPLLEASPLTLEAIARYPLITYDFAFTGRSKINRAFEALGLEPDVVLTAIDSDVIKTYVELGLGVGILASMAFDPARDTHLRAVDAAHLFAPSTTSIAIRRGAWLRGYVYEFITLFAPQLTRQQVDAALNSAEQHD